MTCTNKATKTSVKIIGDFGESSGYDIIGGGVSTVDKFPTLDVDASRKNAWKISSMSFQISRNIFQFWCATSGHNLARFAVDDGNPSIQICYNKPISRNPLYLSGKIDICPMTYDVPQYFGPLLRTTSSGIIRAHFSQYIGNSDEISSLMSTSSLRVTFIFAASFLLVLEILLLEERSDESTRVKIEVQIDETTNI
uniref:Uncharacterized protein n=1 Tax=Romanomermis culicivorax TaxID=13658 RepID=A0A915JJC0_ROMCU